MREPEKGRARAEMTSTSTAARAASLMLSLSLETLIVARGVAFTRRYVEDLSADLLAEAPAPPSPQAAGLTRLLSTGPRRSWADVLEEEEDADV